MRAPFGGVQRGRALVSDQPVEVARAFVGAITWGEHRRIWDLLGQEGRRTVLRVAVKRGMDDGLAARLEAGGATTKESDTFLGELVNGLRADLAGSDLDSLGYNDDVLGAEDGRAWILLTAPMPQALGGAVPVGTVELSLEEGRWRVERLRPRPAP